MRLILSFLYLKIVVYLVCLYLDSLHTDMLGKNRCRLVFIFLGFLLIICVHKGLYIINISQGITLLYPRNRTLLDKIAKRLSWKSSSSDTEEMTRVFSSTKTTYSSPEGELLTTTPSDILTSSSSEQYTSSSANPLTSTEINILSSSKMSLSTSTKTDEFYKTGEVEKSTTEEDVLSSTAGDELSTTEDEKISTTRKRAQKIRKREKNISGTEGEKVSTTAGDELSSTENLSTTGKDNQDISTTIGDELSSTEKDKLSTTAKDKQNTSTKGRDKLLTKEKKHLIVQDKKTDGAKGKHFDENDIKTLGPKRLLLVTYLRSGSTLTADILQQSPGTFYAFEPLPQFLPNKGVFLKLNQTCNMITNQCRSSTSITKKILTKLQEFYTCNLTSYKSLFGRLLNKSDLLNSQYSKCLEEFPDKDCKNHVEDVCRNSSAIMVKTIRLSMEVVEDLLQTFPNLKVLHLLRDPRGMILSRKKGMFLRGFTDKMDIVAKAVCTRYMEDLHATKRLQKIYPNRIKCVQYENVAQNAQHVSTDMYKFFDLTFSENFTDWLTNHTAAGIKSGFYKTFRENSTYTALRWRQQMSRNQINDIDEECQEFYKLSNYDLFE